MAEVRQNPHDRPSTGHRALYLRDLMPSPLHSWDGHQPIAQQRKLRLGWGNLPKVSQHSRWWSRRGLSPVPSPSPLSRPHPSKREPMLPQKKGGPQ